MKSFTTARKILLVAILVFTGIVNTYASPDAEVFISSTLVKVAGENFIDISLYIKRFETKCRLGTSSFVFNFDSLTLKYVNSYPETAPLDRGYFTRGTATYEESITVPYGRRARSIEIDFADSAAEISQAPQLIGTLRFKILNEKAFAGIGWNENYSAINDEKGKLLNIKFKDPGPIYLDGNIFRFNARVVDKKVELSWVTNPDLNVDHFTVERSRDGVHFEKLFSKPGTGMSKNQDYTFFDEHPLEGESFYRLQKTDQSGMSENFELVMVNY
jgi:hypothetical protein